ncbi:MAG: tRNA pseudouridine(38-40) synthase TruA [Deltaproteobacteria bacterium]
MRNLKITLEYAGSRYTGWQTQLKTRQTVQGMLELTLRKILGEKIKVIGSGRTDSGVHALAQVANFKTSSRIPRDRLLSAMNALLPSDIAVTAIEEAPAGFHAQRDVKSKVYRYIILNRSYRSALLKGKVCFCRFPLNVNSMRRESRCLVGRHDFRTFCASPEEVRSTVRTIKRISIKRVPYGSMFAADMEGGSSLIVIDIEANGFLHNMVRSIAGTLIDIGRGRFTRGRLKEILLSKDRKNSGTTAVACGLYLFKVKY